MQYLRLWMIIFFLLVPLRASAQTGQIIDQLQLKPKLEADLSLPPLLTAPAGAIVYCEDCVLGSDPCSGEGQGSFAQRIMGTWSCAGGSLSSASTTFQGAYDLSPSPPTITLGPSGLTFSGANSTARAIKICDITGTQCRLIGVDDSGDFFDTFLLPIDLITKLYTAKTWGLLTSTDLPIITCTAPGVCTVATSLAPTGAGWIKASRTTCTGTDYLKFDGTCAAVSGAANGVTVLDKQVGDTATTAAIASSISEITIYSYSVPANTLGTDSCVRCEISGSLLNDITGTQSVTARVKYGGTSSSSSAASVTIQSATARAIRFQVNLCGAGTTSSQRTWLNWDINGFSPLSVQSGPSINSTTAQDLIVSLQFATSSASLTYTPRYVRSELVP